MAEDRERHRERQAARKRRRDAPNPEQTPPAAGPGEGAGRSGGAGGTGGAGGSGGGAGTGGSGAGGGAAAGRGWARPALALAAALAIGLAAFVGLSGGGDSISEAETNDRIAAHQALLASPGLPVMLVGAEDVDEAIETLPETVPQETRQALRQEIDQGRLQLAWVTLWDTHAEDGDVLRFESSASIPIEIMALNAKTKFAIPYPMDGKVRVTGVKDGGGGITIALQSGATQIAWPTMAPGDTLDLPVTPGF